MLREATDAHLWRMTQVRPQLPPHISSKAKRMGPNPTHLQFFGKAHQSTAHLLANMPCIALDHSSVLAQFQAILMSFAEDNFLMLHIARRQNWYKTSIKSGSYVISLDLVTYQCRVL